MEKYPIDMDREIAAAELTKQEKRVLLCVTMGMTNREIAEELVVSRETVKTHVAHLHKKMGDAFPERTGGRRR